MYQDARGKGVDACEHHRDRWDEPVRRARALGSLLAGLMAAALLLGGCASSSDTGADGAGGSDGTAGSASASAPEASNSRSAAAFPVSVTDAFGTTTIEHAPQRVVCLGWGSQDAALALGVVPVGMSKATFGGKNGLYPWQRAALKNAPTPTLLETTDSVPFEQVAALHPDLILAVQSGLQESEYERLSQIAPTVAYPGEPWLTPWPKQALLVGKALGKADQARQLVAQRKALIASYAQKNPQLAGTTIAYGATHQSGTYDFYTSADPRVQLVEALGMKLAPSVQALTDSDEFYVQVSMERLDDLDDVQVWIAYYESASAEKKLKNQPVYAHIPAIRDGSDVSLTNDTLTMATSSPSVLSLPWALKRFVPMLAAAAAKA